MQQWTGIDLATIKTKIYHPHRTPIIVDINFSFDSLLPMTNGTAFDVYSPISAVAVRSPTILCPGMMPRSSLA